MWRIGGLPERNTPSCWPPMITNTSDNITDKAQNRTQKHKSTNTKIQYLKKEQNRTHEKTQKSQVKPQVSHHRPCREREPRHQLGQGKSGRQRGTATDQMDKRGTWIRKTPSCMNRDAGSYQLSHTWDHVISRSRAPSSCKQWSRRDQDVRQTLKRCHQVTTLRCVE